MPSCNLAKFRADQPNLWAPLVLPACLDACEAAPGAQSSFELVYFQAGAEEPTTEPWSFTHAPDIAPAAFASLGPAAREEILHVAAAGLIAAILRTRDEIRVKRVSRRGPWLDFHLEDADGAEAGVLAAFGTAGADALSALADVVKHVEGAPSPGRKIAGAVAFGGAKAAIRVLS